MPAHKLNDSENPFKDFFTTKNKYSALASYPFGMSSSPLIKDLEAGAANLE
jgi:hypothetical protein